MERIRKLQHTVYPLDVKQLEEIKQALKIEIQVLKTELQILEQRQRELVTYLARYGYINVPMSRVATGQNIRVDNISWLDEFGSPMSRDTSGNLIPRPRTFAERFTVLDDVAIPYGNAVEALRRFRAQLDEETSHTSGD